mmetsp:Transcript_23584/g.73064  ORF Transcript_23584/g.73064 Transcript_23584/m.73064 type:complete len:217 (-) Transcript_23584:506-1156(-)
MRTDDPGATRSLSKRPTKAVYPAHGTAAAAAKETLSGMSETAAASQMVYSAKVPCALKTLLWKATRSPFWKPVTPGPTDSTKPLPSQPRTAGNASVAPSAADLPVGSPKAVARLKSTGFSAAQTTLTRISPALGAVTGHDCSKWKRPSSPTSAGERITHARIVAGAAGTVVRGGERSDLAGVGVFSATAAAGGCTRASEFPRGPASGTAGGVTACW